MISRTGYTGEDGFEAYVSAHSVSRLWDEIMEAGKEYNLIPAGWEQGIPCGLKLLASVWPGTLQKFRL